MEDKKMNIFEKLSHIQNEMNVKKNQYNRFGKYSYRSAEDILAEAKRVCMKYRTTLIVEDELVKEDSRFYIMAVATLYDWDGDFNITTKAFAREEETKKGMDGSQVTGACSSYARKYALNGLFNLDDVKDADTNEQHEQTRARNDSNGQNQSTTDKALDDIRIRCYKAQNALQKLAIDIHSEAFTEHLKETYKITNQDIQNLNANDLVKLLNAYSQIYKENQL